MEYTKNNYLYGTGTGDTWHVNIDPPTRKVRTYFEETVEAVEYVYANKVGKFTVMLSGGVDSQYVCEVLLRLHIDFDVVIIELKNNDNQNYNEHDFKYAYEFCKNKNIIPKIIRLNFDKLVESGKLIEIARSVSCCMPQLVTCLYVINQLDGFILLGHDPPTLRFIREQNIWVLEELEWAHAYLRYYKKFNLNGCPYILSYTPEMMLAFLLDPSIVKLGTGQHPGKLGSNSTKSHVFNRGSDFNIPVYDFDSKIRIKYHGFEEIEKSKISQHDNMLIFKDFYKIWNGEYLEPYTEVIQRLSIFQ